VTKHLNDIIATRRALLGGLAGLPLLNLAACATPSAAPTATSAHSAVANFASVAATNADTISLPPGYSWRPLIAWGDALFDTVSADFAPDTLTRAEQEQRFGQNNDMLALFSAEYAFPPRRDANRLILCANNEYAIPELMFPSVRAAADFTPAQAEAMYASVGVSIVELARDGANWRVQKNAAPGQGKNRRITPFTPVRFTGPAANHRWIVAASEAVNAAEPGAPAGQVSCGTAANCAGGLTPWGTYLTAEENFDGLFVGRSSDISATSFSDQPYALDVLSHGYPGAYFPATLAPAPFRLAQNPYGPSLYGWVVEIDPHDPTAAPKKRTALGRKKNDCANTAIGRDGRVAVYTGDDQRGEHLYKFVTRSRFDPANRAANMDLLDEGDLYAAQFLENGQGRWIKLTVDAANRAAEEQELTIRFADLGDMLMRVRDAARLLGATPMDRPEDVEPVIDHEWRGDGTVLIACTNNSERGFDAPGNPRRESPNQYTAQNNLPGHILRIDEAGGDTSAERFSWDVFALCGDPDAQELTSRTRSGAPVHVSVSHDGEPTFTGDRFACPDNFFIDSGRRVWIATDGSDGVFGDCNDSVLATQVDAAAPRPVKRFLVAPVGAEVCGPTMTPDERAFLCAIQHPGANDVAGADFTTMRWMGEAVPSHFPAGGDSWPRSAVVIVTRDDGGRIGD
jgi:secreted PhoX family phosphatase